MTDTTLANCPFCGGEAEILADEIWCTKCSAKMSICRGSTPDMGDDDRMAELARQWNRRAPDLAVEALRKMARQKLLTELDPDELENADVFGGYDEMVKTARSALETKNMRMDAYYYGFSRTGVDAIDIILSAVACAGKAYHGTENWTDEIERLTRINAELCKSHNALTIDGARQDEEIERLRRAPDLAEALKECADDLEAELLAKGVYNTPRKMARDMEPVIRARQTLAGAGIEDILKEQVNDKSRYLNPSHAGGVVERFDAWLDNEWDRKYKALTVKDRALLKEVRAALAGAGEVVETDELVEKVARAIREANNCTDLECPICARDARAAIRAMLSSAPSAPEGDQK